MAPKEEDLIGRVTVSLSELFSAGPEGGVLPLLDAQGAAVGEATLLLRLQREGDEAGESTAAQALRLRWWATGDWIEAAPAFKPLCGST